MAAKFKAKGGSFRTGDLVFTAGEVTTVEDAKVAERLRKIDKLVEVKEEAKSAAKPEEKK